MQLTIVGLGPGRWRQVTLEAQEVLAAGGEIWLRTRRHPVVEEIPPRPVLHSFDHLYDTIPEFETLYETLATEVLRLAERPEGVIYAVPGHPLVGEATVRRILAVARERGIATRIVPGLSFVDVAIARLGLDPLDSQLQIGDAHDLAADPSRPLLVGQVYDARLVAEVKLRLLATYPADHPVTLVRSAGLDTEETIHEMPLYELDRQTGIDHLTCLYVPALPPERDFRTFAATHRIIARLRAPGGCPWDREQTPESLKPYVIEEAYEVVEAIDSGDPAKVAEELGDLLLQVVLQAQVADDNGDFDLNDVCEAINTKLVRRHPHVFGDLAVQDAREVLANWEVLKERERTAGSSLLQGLPKSLPALSYTQALQRKLGRFDLRTTWDESAAQTFIANLSAAQSAPPGPGRDALAGVFARLIWHLATLAGTHEIDLEDALRTLARSVVTGFEAAEAETGGDRTAIARRLAALWRDLNAPPHAAPNGQ